jgi:hypothetical protein
MQAAAGVRRATLVITIGFLAAGTAMTIPACAVPAAHDATSRPRATAGPAVRRQSRRASARPADPSAALAAALAPVARDHPGRLAVGVVDQTTGTTATYHPDWPFDTASIIKAFHDVTQGNNTVQFPPTTITGYQATPGWDPVTGWGSPDAQTLIPLLAHYAMP